MKPPRPFDHLSEADLDRVLEAALSGGARFAEIFVERCVTRSLRREEGTIRAIGGAVEVGAGIRTIAGEGTGYAYTSEPDLESLLESARSAGRIAATPAGRRVPPAGAGREDSGKRPEAVLPAGWEPAPSEIAARAGFLEEVDRFARLADPRVSEVSASLSEETREIFVANSAGRRVADEQVLVGVSAGVYVRAGTRTQRGNYGGGGRESFDALVASRLAPERIATEAVRRAVVLLDAVEAPAGDLPVVIGNGWGGVLLHEAIGHGFEADFVRRGSSIYTGRMGEKVASSLCTIVDDGSIDRLRGSFGIDDEGTASRRTLLVEKGVLRGYLHDLLSSDAMGVPPTGNGRRESFRCPPIPRQSNIFLEAGGDSPEEIIRSVPRGFYARSLGGGQVDIVNGNFVFQVTEGYLIEEGHVTAPVIGANLIGTGHEILSRVTRVGGDFEFDPGVGRCGKDGQSQPVGVGQPTVLVSAMTVGGTRL